MRIITRPLVPEDGEIAAEIFFDAVHHGTTDVYSVEQRIAWGGHAPDTTKWLNKFQNTSGFAADIGGLMVGFMTLDTDGHIDLAFVRTEFSGHGIGKLLYRLIEAQAVASGLKRLTTEASKKAKPFFIRLGWHIDQEQVVVKNGVFLTNFKMSKSLEMK